MLRDILFHIPVVDDNRNVLSRRCHGQPRLLDCNGMIGLLLLSLQHNGAKASLLAVWCHTCMLFARYHKNAPPGSKEAEVTSSCTGAISQQDEDARICENDPSKRTID